MPTDSSSSSPAAAPSEEPSLRGRISRRIGQIVAWSRASRRNMMIAGACVVGMMTCLIAAWSFLAQLAVSDGERVTIQNALEALEVGRFDDAKRVVGKMQRQATPEEFGGALFVMGAIKAREADEEFSAERRRAMHLVAVRYLEKALKLGVPAELEPRLQFLLGRSLILGNQAQPGISLLKSALSNPDLPAGEIHALLASACLETPAPNLDDALEHLQAVLTDETLNERQRRWALVRRADVLLRIGRALEARDAVAAVPGDQGDSSEKSLLAGRLALLVASRAADPLANFAELDEADARLREAIEQDETAGPATRQAMYWLGQAYVMRGQPEAATEQFVRLGKIYGDSPEGLAALLAAADLYQALGDFDRAQASYRTLLEAAPPPKTYVNSLVPLPELRKRLLAAQQNLVDAGRFDDAVAMLELFDALFRRAEVVELAARTHARWGAVLLDPQREVEPWRRSEDLHAGRLHLRTAARAFEDLARLRAASRAFPDDLWEAAENYFAGQSYSEAARVYQEYLLHEARDRNGAALLRMGQARLATGAYRDAVAALDECVELYPRSDVVFQARLEAARAYRELGQYDRAEQLLWTNLTGDSLTPESPEWRDSKFEIGRLYYAMERYDQAVRELEEAVQRYPDSREALLANYTIARSHHRAAEAPAERARDAKTENERQKNRQLSTDYLEGALATYGDVQRVITLAGGGDHDELHRMLLRNCYMMRGAVLFDLRRFDEAREAYSGLSSLYQNDPFVLEIQVQIASCLRRLNEPIKARLAIVQAQQLLASLPQNADFLGSTNFSRQQWELLLDQMAQW